MSPFLQALQQKANDSERRVLAAPNLSLSLYPGLVLRRAVNELELGRMNQMKISFELGEHIADQLIA